MPAPHFDAANGLLDRGVFASPAIYRQELRSIFARCWLFIGLTSQVAAQGAFLASSLGEQPVVAWRGTDGRLRVFLNRCPGGEAPLCEGGGQALSMRCRCHGIDFASDGTVPGRSAPGLIPIAGLDSYRGLLFATLDDCAPPLATALRGIERHLAAVLDVFAGDAEGAGGEPLRWMLEANWKLPASEFAVSAASGPHRRPTAGSAAIFGPGDGYQVATPGGVATYVADAGRFLDAGEDPALGAPPHHHAAAGQPTPAVSGTVFPNLSFDAETGCLLVWHPRGPARTEVHTWCLVDRAAGPAARHARQRACLFRFGPNGLGLLPWCEPWRAITAEAGRLHTGKVAVAFPLGLGQERPAGYAEYRGDPLSETCQRAFHAWWQVRMDQPTNAPRRSERHSLFHPTIDLAGAEP